MLKRLICLLAMVSAILSGSMISESLGQEPKSKRMNIGKSFGKAGKGRRTFTTEERERFRKMFGRFKSRKLVKPINKTAP